MRAPLGRFGQATATGLTIPALARPLPGAGRADGLAPAAAWYRRPAVQALVALVVYAAAWMLTAGRPMLHGFGKAHLLQLSMDPNFYTWCLRWWPYAIGHGLNPFYTHLIRAPQGHSLAWVTSIPPLALLAAPLTIAAGPVVAFNLLTILALPLSGWAAFVLCRRLTGKFWPALAGGAVFGFSAYQMNHVAAGQLNLTYSLLLPLLAYLFLVWHDGAISGRTFVLAAGFLVAIQFYLFLETFADLTAVLGIAVVASVVLAGRARRAEALRAARYLGAAYGVGFVLALPYLAYALTFSEATLKVNKSLDLASLVVPRTDRLAGMPWLHAIAARPSEVSAAGYIGLPLLVIAVACAVTGWKRKLVRLLSVMLVVVVVASLGPALDIDGTRVYTFPWHKVWTLPLVRNAYPSRLMLFAYLILAVLAALFLASPACWRWLRVPLAVLAAGALLQDSTIIDVSPHSTVPAFISQGYYRQRLAPGETVLVVSDIGNAGMLWQADSNFYLKLAGGYLNQAITKGSDLPEPVQALASATPAKVDRFESYVKTDHIGAVLLDGDHVPAWIGIFKRMGLHGHRYGNVDVYPVNNCQTCKVLKARNIGHHRPPGLTFGPTPA